MILFMMVVAFWYIRRTERDDVPFVVWQQALEKKKQKSKKIKLKKIPKWGAKRILGGSCSFLVGVRCSLQRKRKDKRNFFFQTNERETTTTRVPLRGYGSCYMCGTLSIVILWEWVNSILAEERWDLNRAYYNTYIHGACVRNNHPISSFRRSTRIWYVPAATLILLLRRNEGRISSSY